MLKLLPIFLFLFSTAVAGRFVNDWPTGQVEKLSYEIKTFQPRETTNSLDVEISKSNDKEAVFTLNQKLGMPDQKITIRSIEKYVGEKLTFESSENYIELPAGAVEKFGTDSVFIKAKRAGDLIELSSNSKLVKQSSLPYYKDFFTTTGATFVGRNIDFNVGWAFRHHYANLLAQTGFDIKIMAVVDSVTGIANVSTPAGDFRCYKVKSTVEQTVSYTYYSTDKRHIPVKTELIDPRSGEVVMSVTLQKYETTIK